jgi:hypothetical protein
VQLVITPSDRLTARVPDKACDLIVVDPKAFEFVAAVEQHIVSSVFRCCPHLNQQAMQTPRRGSRLGAVVQVSHP